MSIITGLDLYGDILIIYGYLPYLITYEFSV